MKLETPLVQRLRDHLIARAAESLPPAGSGRRTGPGSPEEQALLERFRPFAEFLYLMAAADGHVDRKEKSLMLGAFRALTGGRISSSRLQQLEDELSERLATEGQEGRLEVVCSALAGQKRDAELAYMLGCALALADDSIDPGEVDLLNMMASWLRISKERARQLIADEGLSQAPRP